MKKILLIILLSITLFGGGEIINPISPSTNNGLFDSNSKCFENKIFKICVDKKYDLPLMGLSIINASTFNTSNIESRPNFYENKNLNYLKPSQVKPPLNLGHTFANDSDNDYDINLLKLTYDMINITPMHENLNKGLWRKIENRGKKLSLVYGQIVSMTLVKWEKFEKLKYNLLWYPIEYQRFYYFKNASGAMELIEGYKVQNKYYGKTKLDDFKINLDDN